MLQSVRQYPAESVTGKDTLALKPCKYKKAGVLLVKEVLAGALIGKLKQDTHDTDLFLAIGTGLNRIE